MGILNQGRGKCVPLSIMACGLLLVGINGGRAQDGKATTPEDRPGPYPGCVKIFGRKRGRRELSIIPSVPNGTKLSVISFSGAGKGDGGNYQ